MEKNLPEKENQAEKPKGSKQTGVPSGATSSKSAKTQAKKTDNSPTQPNNRQKPQNKQPEPLQTTSGSDSPTPGKSTKKNIVIALLVLLLIILTGTAAYFYMQSNNEQSAPAEQQESMTEPSPTEFVFKAKAVYVAGSVFKIEDDRRIEIKENDVLNEGESLETGDDGRIVLTLDEGSVVRIAENSQVDLSTLSPSLISVNNQQGVVFARVDTDEEHEFNIIAGDVTVSSQGTAFSVEKNEDVEVLVFENKVNVKTQQKEQEVNKDEQWDRERNQVKALETQRIANNEFYKWSLEEEKLSVTTPAPTKEPAPTKTQSQKDQKKENSSSVPTGPGSIWIYAEGTHKGIIVRWAAADDLDVSNGFRVIKSTQADPTYPGNDSVFVNYSADTFKYSHKWEIFDGQTYHIRVCQVTGSSCGVYSQDISVTTVEQ